MFWHWITDGSSPYEQPLVHVAWGTGAASERDAAHWISHVLGAERRPVVYAPAFSVSTLTSRSSTLSAGFFASLPCA